MYQHPENNNDNNKMATEKKQFIGYKATICQVNYEKIFDLNCCVISKNANKVYCIHSDKSFAYQESNTSLIYHLKKNTCCNIQNRSFDLIKINY